MKVKIGDVVELEVKEGYAYCVFSHYHDEPPKYGALLRILNGVFSERQHAFEGLVAGKEKSSVFFPLQAAVNKGLVRVVGHIELPEHMKAFPLFKNHPDPKASVTDTGWCLWDGKREWQVGTLSEEQRSYPYPDVVNDTALREMIESA